MTERTETTATILGANRTHAYLRLRDPENPRRYLILTLPKEGLSDELTTPGEIVVRVGGIRVRGNGSGWEADVEVAT